MKSHQLHLSLVLLLSLLALANTSFAQEHAPEQVLLKKWQFSKDQQQWQTVTIPHSCNAIDGRSAAYYRGKAYYRQDLTLTESDLRKHLYLLFEGAAQAATVTVNGTVVKTHKGGYTPFLVVLDGQMKAGVNRIEVCTDNTEDTELIPVASDFNKNNGLHNPVWLLKTGDQYLCPGYFGPYRLHVSTPYVTNDEALVRVETRVMNPTATTGERQLDITLRNAQGAIVASEQRTVYLHGQDKQVISADLTVRKPHLWNGILDPYLYTAEVALRQGNGGTAVIDHASTKVGLRYFQLTQNHGFLLNGKPFPLRGIAVHQDYDGVASAMTREQYDADYRIITELGANMVRMAHYPHNDYAMRLCDSLGLVVQTEIPWVNVCGVNATPTYFANIHQQMKEMITSLYNHPSIIFWGMFNELDQWGNNDHLQGRLDARRAVREVSHLYDYAKSLDPWRLIGLTDCSMFSNDDYELLKGDFYSENRYHGWYYDWQGGMDDKLYKEMTRVHHLMGPMNISEYGAGSNPFCHTLDSTVLLKSRKDDSRHFEEYANYVHENDLRMIQRMPWLGFTTLWVMFDFPVASRQEGYVNSNDGIHFTANDNRKYMNDKGIVTRDRKTRKDVFYLYKSLWNQKTTTVYITSRRMTKRQLATPMPIHVYSNAHALTLSVNGRKVETLDHCADATGVIWDFQPVMLRQGKNIIVVTADDGSTDTISVTSGK